MYLLAKPQDRCLDPGAVPPLRATHRGHHPPGRHRFDGLRRLRRERLQVLRGTGVGLPGFVLGSFGFGNLWENLSREMSSFKFVWGLEVTVIVVFGRSPDIGKRKRSKTAPFMLLFSLLFVQSDARQRRMLRRWMSRCQPWRNWLALALCGSPTCWQRWALLIVMPS